jgi:hypothetical protein
MIRPYNEGIGGKLGLAIGWKLYEIGTPIEEQLKMADQKMYHDKIVFNGSTGPSSPLKAKTVSMIFKMPNLSVTFADEDASDMPGDNPDSDLRGSEKFRPKTHWPSSALPLLLPPSHKSGQ